MSIYKRGNRWWIDHFMGDGSRIRRSLQTDDRSVAEKRARALKLGLEFERPAPAFDLKKRLWQMKDRARRNGWAFRLTFEDLEFLIAASGGRCELTGIPFRQERSDEWTKAPFAPTVDRIDRTKGYVHGNCRIVCHAVNVAINEWGQDVFEEVAVRYLARRFVAQNPPQTETS